MSWKLLYDGMVSVFPGLSGLRLQAPGVECPRVVMSDLQNLLSLPMEELVIRGVRTGLTQEDLEAMTKAWPTLRKLRLPNCEKCVAITAALSAHWSSELHELELPLDFTAFTSPRHDLPAIQKTRLHRLLICLPTKLPLALSEKARLAGNLLAVCPNLEIV